MSLSPPESRAATTPGPALDSGVLPIDLLNTTWFEHGDSIDWLISDEGVVEFAAAYGFDLVGSADKKRGVKAARASLMGARELVGRLFDSAGDSDSDAELGHQLTAHINAILKYAQVRLQPSLDGGPPSLKVTASKPEQALAVEAVVSAINLLTEKPERVRSCAHDMCTVWFVDVSKAGRRRWCSMDRCGNRAKARRHQQRMSG